MARKSNQAFTKLAKLYQSRLEDANRVIIGELNGTDSALLNQLFVIAGGLITLSSPLVVTTEILKALPLAAKISLVCTVACAIGSIVCGIVQFYKNIRFLRRRRETNDGIIDDIAKRRIKSLERLLARYEDQRNDGKRASSKWMIAQFVFLAASGLCIAVVMGYIILFAKIK